MERRDTTRPVLLTDGAARDLDELYAAAYERGGFGPANRILDRIRSGLERIAQRSEDGRPPPELRALGMRGAREVRIDGHRIVYRTRGEEEVHVVLIAAETRSMQSLLQRRMLDA